MSDFDYFYKKLEDTKEIMALEETEIFKVFNSDKHYVLFDFLIEHKFQPESLDNSLYENMINEECGMTCPDFFKEKHTLVFAVTKNYSCDEKYEGKIEITHSNRVMLFRNEQGEKFLITEWTDWRTGGWTYIDEVRGLIE